MSRSAQACGNCQSTSAPCAMCPGQLYTNPPFTPYTLPPQREVCVGGENNVIGITGGPAALAAKIAPGIAGVQATINGMFDGMFGGMFRRNA